MKTMKYRSVFGAICTVALSVFLFTSCEKESDNLGKPDRLEKFKRLVFSGSGGGATGSTNSSSGSGTFIGGGGANLSYIPPSGSGNSNQFAPSVPGGGEFTDPMSTGNSFVVANSFFGGGGTFSLGRESYDLDFGFCVSSDIFGGDIGGPTADEGDLEMFIGVSGDFDFSMAGEDEPDDLGIELILYVFSYNGGSDIGDFDVFEGNGDPSNSAFVLAVTFVPGADEDATIYYGKSGSVDFSGGSVSLGGLRMAKVEDGGQGDVLSTTLVNAAGFLECGSIVFNDDDDDNL